MKRKRDRSGSPDPKAGHSRNSDRDKARLFSRFSVKEVKRVIYDILRKNLRGRRYENDLADEWANRIANEIRNELTDCGLDRYKLICQVTLCEARGSCLKNHVGCSWDEERDRVASDEYIGDEICSSATVFGCFIYGK